MPRIRKPYYSSPSCPRLKMFALVEVVQTLCPTACPGKDEDFFERD